MELVNNKAEAPLLHYRAQFAAADPELLAVRSAMKYDKSVSCFSTVLLSRELNVVWPSGKTTFVGGMPASASEAILVLRLLLNGSVVADSGKFLSYSQTPWGDIYRHNFDGRCVRRLASAFGADPERIVNAAKQLSGVEIDGADYGVELEFMPQLNIRLLLWHNDEEFPASAQILFSDNFPLAFSAEDLAVVGDILINRLWRFK